jgi:hypothetical protein
MKTHIHKRNISVDTFETGDGSIMVEGKLRDDRLMPSFVYSTRKFMEPGVIHDIAVRLTISLPRLLIEKAEADMRHVPSDVCREVITSVERLVGLEIKHGFTQNVIDSMGGIQGCVHMTNLILAMGSAAVQGQWAYYSRKRGDSIMKLPKFDPSLVINSCWLWREDGEYIKRMTKILKKEKSKEE